MIVVIQCAASKRPGAGYFQTKNGRPLMFVADPERAPVSPDLVYARPDDLDEEGEAWRACIVRYNETPDANPFRLSHAYELYENDTYRLLVDRFGAGNTFILSAGWGLIGATFLTPRYDITFSASAAAYARRLKVQSFRDFSMLPAAADGPVVFFGGKDYVPLFVRLSASTEAERIVFYNSNTPPSVPGCNLKLFRTRTRTNWHYECARAFVAGDIDLRLTP